MIIKNTDLRRVDGQTVYPPRGFEDQVAPGNIALPNVYEQSASQLYPIGTRYEDGERVFHYAYAGGEIALTLRGATGLTARTQSSQDTDDTAQVAGVGYDADHPFKIDGTSANTPAKNAYAGQYIMIQATGSNRITMRIVSNTQGITASPYTTELVLDQPTPIAIGADKDCDIFPSRYADVRAAADYAADMYPVLGVPLVSITAARYFWIQTWGPCFLTARIGDTIGDNSFWRTVCFHSDGSLTTMHEATNATDSHQFAGYTLATNASADEWIQLMLNR